ncbi:putative polyketide synthase [Tothia fuscella]|uniref:Polyketide synthase n=1 Tax=Tothia fuscella TaxID=1048955 RepID=A0A9P4NFL8_9PEZI|nr:putative polyketide synthase [Tothia fuscella]
MNGSNGIGETGDPTLPIAIIGLSARLPGDATDPESLYRLCADAKDAWSPVPSDRFNQEAFYHPDPNRNGTSNVRGAHFLNEDLALFDAPFFGMTKAEAAALDPQQRLLLESCYEAFENAGIRMEDVFGSNTSVFVGSFCKDWGEITLRDPGIGQAMLSNRLSYYFNLTGPSVTLDTACSASLVALHLAVQSLKSGESKQAVVGGVNVMLNHDMMVTMSSMRFLSPDGRSYTYDSRANGYARGEGVSCLILKPLADALAAGDTIRAVIRNTGVNSDGKTMGITLPSPKAQAALIKKTYADAGLDPLETNYVETHGTGTQAGDPLEAAALAEVFGRNRTDPIDVGSIKTNVGHLEGASGVAGLVKTVLMLENKMIVPNAHFDVANERIPLDEWRLMVPTELKEWDTTLRRASINSFGYGGTNAHVIVDEAEGYLAARNLVGLCRKHKTQLETSTAEPSLTNRLVNGHSSPPTRRRLFTLSTFDELCGLKQAENLAKFIEQMPLSKDHTILDDIAYSLNDRRSLFSWRFACHAENREQLTTALRVGVKYAHSPKNATVAFCFTGQGAQWYAMGRELIEMSALFRNTILDCSEHLQLLGAKWSILEELSKPLETSRVNEAAFSQPCCTAVQIALTNLLHSWGVRPAAVVGHSSGEIAAAYAAQILSLHDSMAVSYYRGVCAARVPKGKGGMAAINATEAETKTLISTLGGEVSIACFNSEKSLTVSGDAHAIDELLNSCKERNIFARRLLVDVAYHSPHMTVVADDYHNCIANVRPQEGTGVPFYSSVTGKLLEPSLVGPEYWVQNLLSPVQFLGAVSSMCSMKSNTRRGGTSQKSPNIIVELGPHSALAGPVKQIVGRFKTSYLSALIRGKDAVETTMDLASQLYALGIKSLNFSQINNPDGATSPSLVVDLPKYPFNHQVSYWAEPRESILYRLRKWPRHDLLGAPVRMPNTLEPRWRNWIRSSELPWINDHKVQGLVVYPAAGFIAMAVEAAFQRASSLGMDIESYELREISIGQAMIIPETSGEVESMLSLRPYSENSRASSDIWDDFRVSSAAEDGTWTEHCRGLISVKAKHKTGNEVNDLQQEDEELMYESCLGIGLDYGASFANLIKARGAANRTSGVIKVPSIEEIMPAKYHSPCVVHPATLDACFHVCFPAQGILTSPIVPTFISKMSISHDITKTAGEELEVHMKVDKRSLRDTISSEIVFQKGKALPVISITSLTTTSLNTTVSTDGSKAPRKTYFREHWGTDAALLTSSQYENMCAFLSPGTDEASLSRLLDEMGFYIAERALSKVPESFVPSMAIHNQKLYKSVRQLQSDVHNSRLPFDVSAWLATAEEQRDVVWEKVRQSGDEGRFVALVGDNLHRILLQEVDPLEVVMEDDALGKYYANNSRMKRQYEQAAIYIDILAHKNPQMKILEIGSGTGGATFNMLRAFGGNDRASLARFSSYDVTDISTGFFEKVQEKAQLWGDLVHYRKLDIEQDPAGQGFEMGSYDLIIAANVLHATRSMDRTMTNVRKLMKPGGKLVLTELMRKSGGIANLFGIFPGWWIGEEEDRQEGALLAEEGWDSILRKTGFGGIELCIWDTPDISTHQGSNLIATAVESPPVNGVKNGTTGSRLPNTTIVTEDMQESVLTLLRDKLPGTTQFAKLADVRPHGRVCIVLSELLAPILGNPRPEQFESLKTLMLESEGILWVTRGAVIDGSHPDLDMISGLMRTLRMELGGSSLITLDLEATGDAERTGWITEAEIQTVLRVFEHNFQAGVQPSYQQLETEYAERGGVLLIPRLVEDSLTGDFVASRIQNASPVLDTIVQPERPLKVEIGTPGLLDSLYFDDDKRMTGEPAPDEIDIEVKAAAVNFRDVMMAMGQIETHALGCEASGIVARVGSRAEGFNVGDRVITHADGSFSNFIRVKPSAGGVVAVPEGMDFEVATTLPIVYCTSLHAIRVANLQRGETVLIHAASGGLGQALIMLCQYFGAEIFATVGTKEKQRFIVDNYGIPEDHIFSSRDSSFASGVMRRTQGRGIDVIMNSLSSDLLRVTWECIASFGRFIELGKKDFAVNSRLEMAPFARNVSYIAVDLVTLLEERPKRGRVIWQEVMDLIGQGHIKAPQPISVYGMGDLEKVLRIMSSGKHMGKMVLVPRAEEKALVMPPPLPPTRLKHNATYLLAGGLGGIGRALAIWMVNHGARYIAFTSRSGIKQAAAAEAVRDLERRGATVKVVTCDISDEGQLKAALIDIGKDLPPIKGLIQSALVIKNDLFANMSLEEVWIPSLKPKVQGTWNLHRQLPADLDFFIMLSSMVGIFGNQGQAAYGAASSFQDSFAVHRNSLGLPATTIDLGMVTGVGYVAERSQLQQNLTNQEFEQIPEEECMAIIESAIVHSGRPNKTGSIMTGVGLANFAAGGGKNRPFYYTPKFSHFRRMAESSSGIDHNHESGSLGRVRDFLEASRTFAEAVEHVVTAVLTKTSTLLMIPAEDLDAKRAMSEYGMDSLVAVEMRNWITREIEVTVPILELLGKQSIQDLCKNIARQSKLVERSLLTTSAD